MTVKSKKTTPPPTLNAAMTSWSAIVAGQSVGANVLHAVGVDCGDPNNEGKVAATYTHDGVTTVYRCIGGHTVAS